MNITTSPSSLPLSLSLKDRWLRMSLLVDAAVTGVNGLVYIGAAALLTTVLGPPAPFLIGIGVFLTGCAFVFLLVGRAPVIPLAGARFAIVTNVAWSVASVIYALVADWLTTVGTVWAVIQALVVLSFGLAQLIGVRRARS